MIKIGNADIVNIYVGDTPATAVYIGDTQIWGGGGKDYSKEYFTLSALESGDFYWNVSNVEYSLNDGAWTTWTATDSANTLSVSADDKVRFRSSANTTYNGLTINATGQFDVEGNSMSLFYGDNFIGQTAFPAGSTNKSPLAQVFKYTTTVINAENLILPATSVGIRDYASLFEGCTNLVSAPELPATSVNSFSYQNMFEYCTHLVKAPSILPATTLGMYCYSNMFKNCTNLNYVKCLATDISANRCTYNWLEGVSATGTFVKDATMVDWTTGASGIPDGWTVQSI